MARAKTQSKSASGRTSINIRHLKCVLLGCALALLVSGHGFAAKWWEDPPPGQPEQMWSEVEYDPKLSDPFFKSKAWSYPEGIVRRQDGRYYDMLTDKQPRGEPARLKHTANCLSNSLIEHKVRFCEVKLLDSKSVDLLFHECDGEFQDRLLVSIRHGVFACQYWTFYVRPTGNLIWTTKRQTLTLDKRTYRKGDVIKGRIDFECKERQTNGKHSGEYRRNPSTIRVQGVFKTIVK